MSNYICPCCGAKYEIKSPGTYQCECGKEFTITAAQTPKKNICPFCKSELHPEAVKCSHCGEWLSGEAPQSKTLYLIIGIFFGPIAEFIIGNYLTGILLSIFYYGSVALWLSAVSSGAHDAGAVALFPGIMVVIYLMVLFTTKVGVEKEIYIQQQKGKKSSLIAPLIFAVILILAVSAIAIYQIILHPQP